MLRNSQYFKPVSIANGDSTFIIGCDGYSSLKFELGSQVVARLNSDGHFDYAIRSPQVSNEKTIDKYSFDRHDLISYIFKDWKYGGYTSHSFFLKEPKIKTSILKNHFRQVDKGELLKIKCSKNDKYGTDPRYSNTITSYPNEFLFKKFEEETIMFLGSEMKPLSSEDYHTNRHLSAAKMQNEARSKQNFLHMNFLIRQRRISYSELDFLHGDLFVDSFCYNRGKLYTNKNKKVK